MVCGNEGLSDWCPLRKSQRICGERQSKTIPVINVIVWRIHGLWYFSEPGHSLSSLPPDPCLKELILLPTQHKWSYLSHPYVSVIGGLHCCWMKRIKVSPGELLGDVASFVRPIKRNAECLLNYTSAQSFICLMSKLSATIITWNHCQFTFVHLLLRLFWGLRDTEF